jgi:phospholipid/cholesterol/gamma-HCH transport system substrate-binding protein
MYERQKKMTWAQLRVGVVLTVTLVLVFATVFFSEAIFGLFTPRAPLYMQMRDVGGLRTGAPVWLLGVEIGIVEEIELGAEKITVTLQVDRNALNLVHRDARATVMTMGLLGDKYVAIDPGSGQEPRLEPGAVIPGAMPPEISEIVETTAQATGKVEDFLSFVDSLTRSFTSRKGNITRLLYDSTLYISFTNAISNIEAITGSIRYGEGSLSKLIGDERLYASATAASGELRRFAAALNDTGGTLSRMIRDSSLYVNLNASAARLSSVLRRLEEREGLAGALMFDPTLAADLKAAVRSIRSLIEKIEADPKKYFKLELF